MIVNDKMQQGYEYVLLAPMGQDFAPDFTPELSPKQMLSLGVFEGHYLTDCQAEFPADWFIEAKLSPQYPDIKQNCFGVKSENSAEKEGAIDTITFSFKVRSCFALPKSSRICFAFAGQ